MKCFNAKKYKHTIERSSTTSLKRMMICQNSGPGFANAATRSVNSAFSATALMGYNGMNGGIIPVDATTSFWSGIDPEILSSRIYTAEVAKCIERLGYTVICDYRQVLFCAAPGLLIIMCIKDADGKVVYGDPVVQRGLDFTRHLIGRRSIWSWVERKMGGGADLASAWSGDKRLRMHEYMHKSSSFEDITSAICDGSEKSLADIVKHRWAGRRVSDYSWRGTSKHEGAMSTIGNTLPQDIVRALDEYNDQLEEPHPNYICRKEHPMEFWIPPNMRHEVVVPAPEQSLASECASGGTPCPLRMPEPPNACGGGAAAACAAFPQQERDDDSCSSSSSDDDEEEAEKGDEDDAPMTMSELDDNMGSGDWSSDEEEWDKQLYQRHKQITMEWEKRILETALTIGCNV